MNKFPFLGGPKDDVLYHFSDKEINTAVEEMGLAKAAATIITHGTIIEKIKRELDEVTPPNGLPKELHDFINAKRAKHIFFMDGLSFQVNKQDRMGINWDNLCANFELGLSYDDPEKYLEGFQKFLLLHENLGDFLMRTPEEYFKVLIYHLKLKKIDDMFDLFKAFEKHRQDLLEAGESIFGYGGNYYYYQEAVRAPTEFVCAFSPTRLSKILTLFHIKNMQEFIDLFIKSHYMYPFLMGVNFKLLEYFAKANGINSGEKCKTYFQKENLRNCLTQTSSIGEIATQNLMSVLKIFQTTDIHELEKIDDTLFKTLAKTPTQNISALNEIYNPSSLDDFLKILSHPYISSQIEGVNYASLVKLFGILKISQTDILTLCKKLFETLYTPQLSRNIENLTTTLEKYRGNTGNLGLYIIFLLTKENGLEENIAELFEVITSLDGILSQPGTSKNIDFSRLIKLSDFMGGYITSYLAGKILKTSDVEGLLLEWEKEIQHYKSGNFDPENTLHINLEYKFFKDLSRDENIAKYMGKKFSFSEYTHLFGVENATHRLYEQDIFELECIAYEATLLKEYLLQLNETAKRQNRRLMVVPNLTYGYLPLCAIVHELEKEENIDICIGPKVGSTESHWNMEVLNSTLLKGKRTQIINQQPMIAVIDGTRNITPQKNGGEAGRYPDAYQGYLNQVIAINYALGLSEIEQMKGIYAGKDKDDLKRLVESYEFKRTVEVYKNLFNGESNGYYEFGLWNTGKYPLYIRGNHDKKLSEIKVLSPENLYDNPAIVFCNVGILHDDIPATLKKSRYTHEPAYFDDSGRIINFEYRYDSTGIQFVNSIEAYLQKLQGNTTTGSNTAILKHQVPITCEE